MRFWTAGLLAAALAMPALAAERAPVALATDGGRLWLRPNPDLLQQLGLRAESELPSRGLWELPLLPRRTVHVELGDGAPTRLIDGKLAVPALRFRRADGARSPALSLVPDPQSPLGWQFIDRAGQVWLRIAHVMRSPDRERDGLRLITADLRVGPALAAWTQDAASGRLLANAELRLPLAPLSSQDQAKAFKSCVAPNYPGTPGYVADVELIDMDDKYTASVGVDVQRCRTALGGVCDGPGGDEDRVVIVPSAVLRNRTSADAADLPWHNKFTGIFPPYGNDQHPFLVWNLYRFDAEGRIEQIARSGLKHAFATANESCHADALCMPNGNILGRSCQDTYNAGSNDAGSLLSPRSEMIAALGVWGRCGSVFDPDCNGAQNIPADDGYRERLVASESDIDATANPGAQYSIDAWYVVRDDINIYNSMGSRTLAPEFSNGFWNPGALGPFRQGAVIDRWFEAAPAGSVQQRSELASSEGHIVVAARAVPLPDGRWRYDYAVMNFDFARAVTAAGTAEPNLRVLSNLGLSALELALPNGATVDSSEFRDGDTLPGNDWTVTNTGSLRWSSPGVGVGTLDWGRLVFLRAISPSGPSSGELRMDVAQPGSPAFYSVTTVVPDGEKVFRSGFE